MNKSTIPDTPPGLKIFAGPRLKRLRLALGLTQARMAHDLGVSHSYLNLIERNQRPLTAAVLLKLVDIYDIDIRNLTAADIDQRIDKAATAFRRLGATPGRQELLDFVEQHPALAEAVSRLSTDTGEAVPAAPEPLDLVRAHLLDRGNHFAALESSAEALADELRLGGRSLDAAVRDRLATRHRLHVRILPLDVMPDQLRRLDHHNRQLQLSETLDGASRTFQLCAQLAQLEAGSVIDAELAGAAPALRSHPFASRLLAGNLASYWAAALMMPYARFHAACESLGYDMELLQARFSSGFEQVAHRLTTLQRPGARGIPFLLIRADRAGQISKRFAAGRLPFAAGGGHCPLWILHAAFESPGRILTQIAALESGETLFTIARTVRPQITPWGAQRPRFAIALSCAIEHAGALVYSGGAEPTTAAAVPIGPGCPACFRVGCRQRSAPPAGAELDVPRDSRGLLPYSFGTYRA